MRLTRFLLLLLATALLVAIFAYQISLTGFFWWAAERQREIQNAMAGALRSIQAGDPAALLGLCGLTFAYGFAHAIGPGHGKVLIGGAAFAGRARLLRLAFLTLAASIGQSLTAVILVLTGSGLIALSSRQLIDFTEQALAPLSYAAVALIGLWLALRGGRAMWRILAPANAQSCNGPGDEHCGCGHRHAPTLAEIGDIMSPREMLALVLSIALRPCTGALFLLVIAWRLQILPAGIIATFSMGLGTASFNIIMACSGLWLNLAVSRFSTGRVSGLISPMTQLFAGLLIAVASATMLLRFA
ncbi:hypothetical protein PAF17_12085 [Paracoccus sp. Z330]|uniref:Nickel/cobalt efflux system n=1 Tax=Paracoccus onchidii TaxID=3017813 RepID=A0ABT4ZG49_9RHOB|nr:hypothetical protein [Paracoccus onchidii]MDB6178234.1 hypothetical protein [Paracoccus onchidii]